MNIIIISLLFFLQLFIFFAFGVFFTSFFRINVSSITLTLFSGFIFYFCIFGIIAIPMILISQPLSTLTYSIMIITGIFSLCSLFLYRRRWGALLQNIPDSFHHHSYMLFPLLTAVFLLQLAVFTHIDWSADGSYYIGKITTDVYTNTMGHYNPYTGSQLYLLDNRRVFACFPEYNAVISQFFQIHPLKQAKLIMPQILALFTSILYYQIGLQLFHGNRKKADCLVCIAFLLDLYSYTIYTNSTFLLTRTYEGKSILANIIIPAMFYCFFILWEKPESTFIKKLLFAISLSSCFFSSSSMLIVPVGLTAGLFPWILKRKCWKNIWLYMLCIMPNMIICILYLLSTKGLLVYPI